MGQKPSSPLLPIFTALDLKKKPHEEQQSIFLDSSTLFVVGTKDACVRIQSSLHNELILRSSQPQSSCICLFPSISMALNALPSTTAGPIYICPGSYPETIAVSNRSVELIGLSFANQKKSLKESLFHSRSEHLQDEAVVITGTGCDPEHGPNLIQIDCDSSQSHRVTLKNIIVRPLFVDKIVADPSQIWSISGISISGPVCVSLQHAEISNSGFGIALTNGCQVDADDVTIVSCHREGINAFGSGTELVINNSTIKNPGSDGILLSNYATASITNCSIIESSHGNGISAQYNASISMTNSKIQFCAESGILIDYSSKCAIEGCNIDGCHENGFTLNGIDFHLKNCEAVNCKRNGFFTAAESSGTLESCAARDCDLRGFHVDALAKVQFVQPPAAPLLGQPQLPIDVLGHILLFMGESSHMPYRLINRSFDAAVECIHSMDFCHQSCCRIRPKSVSQFKEIMESSSRMRCWSQWDLQRVTRSLPSPSSSPEFQQLMDHFDSFLQIDSRIEIRHIGDGPRSLACLEMIVTSKLFHNLSHCGLDLTEMTATIGKDALLPLLSTAAKVLTRLDSIRIETLNSVAVDLVASVLQSELMSEVKSMALTLQKRRRLEHGLLVSPHMLYEEYNKQVLTALSTSPTLTQLTRLDLSYCSAMSADCIRALFGYMTCFRLESLKLRYVEFEDEACMALAQSRAVGSLRHLDLRWNYVTYEGVRALAASLYLGQLRTLDVSRNEGVKKDECWSIIQSQQLLDSLKTLECD